MSNRPNSRARAGRRPPPRPTAAPPRRWWQSPALWVVALVVVAGGVAIALSIGGDDGADVVAGEIGFAEIVGDPLPAFDKNAPTDPAVGMTAPTISATTSAGDRVRIGDDGIARLYGFFAHWCPHCQAELPRVTAWLAEGGLPAGVDLVAISTAVDPSQDNYPPRAWFAREGFPEPVVLDSEGDDLAAGLGLTGWPFFVAVGADGTVVSRVSGELSREQLVALAASVAPADVGGTGDGGQGEASGLRTVEATSAARLLTDPPADLVVLDVRTDEEFADGHLADAIQLDFYRDDFRDRLADLDPDVPYLLYCRSGNRSGQTLALMEELGFSDVTDVDGGIVAWAAAGLPVVG